MDAFLSSAAAEGTELVNAFHGAVYTVAEPASRAALAAGGSCGSGGGGGDDAAAAAAEREALRRARPRLQALLLGPSWGAAGLAAREAFFSTVLAASCLPRVASASPACRLPLLRLGQFAPRVFGAIAEFAGIPLRGAPLRDARASVAGAPAARPVSDGELAAKGGRRTCLVVLRARAAPQKPAPAAGGFGAAGFGAAAAPAAAVPEAAPETAAVPFSFVSDAEVAQLLGLPWLEAANVGARILRQQPEPRELAAVGRDVACEEALEWLCGQLRSAPEDPAVRLGGLVQDLFPVAGPGSGPGASGCDAVADGRLRFNAEVLDAFGACHVAVRGDACEISVGAPPSAGSGSGGSGSGGSSSGGVLGSVEVASGALRARRESQVREGTPGSTPNAKATREPQG